MKIIPRIFAVLFSLVLCAAGWGAPPTTQPGSQPQMWLDGWTAAGGVIAEPPPPPPPPTPLSNWLEQVHVAPGPYIANGADLKPIIEAAKKGDSISCQPKTGLYRLSGTTTIPAGVSVYLNGSALACTVTPGSNSNFIMGAGSLLNGAHVTKAATFVTTGGKGVQVHNVFSDDYKPGANATDWAGVSVRFIDSELVDTDDSPNTDIQGCWIGITVSQGIYITNNFFLNNCRFSGSTQEYGFRTEVTGPKNDNRCQFGIAQNCQFLYVPTNGKGSTIGIRMAGPANGKAGSITFRNCFIQSNIRVGQQPASPPWPADATAYANNIILDGCKFVSIGQREAITSLNGTTLAITNSEFWVDQNPVSIAIAPTWNSTTVANSVVHKPANSPWHRLTNQDGTPGVNTIISTVPYVVPQAPSPF